jgi:hypothetical protein
MSRYNAGTGQGGTQQVMSTSYKTLVGITCPATVRRAWIYDVMAGADGTPADNSMAFIVDRQTTVGTGTAVTPRPLDPHDGATTIVGTVNHTAEPTITADTDLLEIGGNQRAAFRWVCSPGGELVVPATNLNGIGLRAKSPSGYILTVIGSVHFWD